jgi:hypothetical protein
MAAVLVGRAGLVNNFRNEAETIDAPLTYLSWSTGRPARW